MLTLEVRLKNFAELFVDLGPREIVLAARSRGLLREEVGVLTRKLVEHVLTRLVAIIVELFKGCHNFFD